MILRQILRDDMVVLELGSGRSTIFLASKTQHLESLEHHKGWHLEISKRLEQRGVRNVNYILLEPEWQETKQELEQRHKLPFDQELSHYTSYYQHIDSYPDNYFDLILNDGRARVECTHRAVSKLKSGGVFILDNSERVRYKPIHQLLRDWDTLNTTTGLTDTTFWFKA